MTRVFWQITRICCIVLGHDTRSALAGTMKIQQRQLDLRARLWPALNPADLWNRLTASAHPEHDAADHVGDG
jgi:hypothetical protein